MSNEWEVMEELGCNRVQWGFQKNKQYPRWNIVILPSELKEHQVSPTQITNEVIQSDHITENIFCGAYLFLIARWATKHYVHFEVRCPWPS